jgi:hypothetical protein
VLGADLLHALRAIPCRPDNCAIPASFCPYDSALAWLEIFARPSSSAIEFVLELDCLVMDPVEPCGEPELGRMAARIS